MASSLSFSLLLLLLFSSPLSADEVGDAVDVDEASPSLISSSFQSTSSCSATGDAGNRESCTSSQSPPQQEQREQQQEGESKSAAETGTTAVGLGKNTSDGGMMPSGDAMYEHAKTVLEQLDSAEAIAGIVGEELSKKLYEVWDTSAVWM